MIPQSNPKAGYLAHRQEIDEAIARVMDSGWYILGQEVKAFEQEFATYLGAGAAVGVASGTDALELALRAGGIGPGDEVFTVSHTAVATVVAIERAGATPVLVDIDPATWTMDPHQLDEAVDAARSRSSSAPRRRPKAIIPVHLYGQPADMPAIMDVAERHELLVIEDCAQATGATLAGRRLGTWGHLAAFSFYPTKNLGAFGDGGMVVSRDAALDDRLRSLREYGWVERYVSTFSGINSRLDELQAAILGVKLPHLDEENEVRRHLAALYGEMLQGTPVRLPVQRPTGRHVYHQFAISSDARDSLREHLRRKGIGTAIHYPQPVHQQRAYRNNLRGPGGLAESEAICRRILSLPMYPQLTDQDARTVATAILESLAE